MNNEVTKQQILTAWLDNIPFDGVTWASIQNTCQNLGLDKDVANALFPHKVLSALSSISKKADSDMLNELETIDINTLSIRERIKLAAETRINIMGPHKEAYRKITSYWANPIRIINAKKLTWASADNIWNWAGDTSNDYNFYTKRSLLSGILSLSYIFWLQDNSNNHQKTEDFLSRRIENTVKVGRFIHTVRSKIPNRV